MGTRAQRPAAAVRKSKAATVQAVQPLRVAARVDGFLEVVADPPRRRPVREKVERRLKQLHPMD